MANVAYSAFFPYLIPLVPHVADPVAEHAIRSACIEFCRKSLAWQAPMEPLSTSKGESAYELDVPSGAMLTHIVDLYYEGRRLEKTSVSEVAAKVGYDWMVQEGTPGAYLRFNPNEITLIPKPDKSVVNVLTGLLAFAPTRGSTTVIDFIFEDYADAIVHGAVARLLMIPNQQWTDPKTGLGYYRQFSADCANARSFVNTGQVRAPISVHMRRYW